MFFVTILGSGSAGNCALVETAQTRLLIDGGLSARQIGARLALCGVNPLEIDGILLTHEHGDHAGALDVWCKKFHWRAAPHRKNVILSLPKDLSHPWAEAARSACLGALRPSFARKKLEVLRQAQDDRALPGTRSKPPCAPRLCAPPDCTTHRSRP